MHRMSLAVVLLLGFAANGSGQDRPAAFVGGSISAANMDSHTDPAFAGSFGYRFNRVVSLVMEATAVPKVRGPFPSDTPVIQALDGATSLMSSVSIVQIYPGPTYANPGGRIVMFTNAARLDIPTSSARLTPFFTAGGGVASVKRTADFTYPIPILTPAGAPSGLPVQLRPITQHVTSSSTNLALTLGGGAGIRLTSALFLDVDLRLYRLLADDDRNLGRFGVGARYAF
jgi:opacity protein-like surface antigen